MKDKFQVLKGGLGYIILLSFSLWISCANPIGSLPGGVKDETPPVVILEESTPSPTTNFTSRQIELTFNEWVRLNNANQQVIVSPLLEYKPEIRIKKKSVLFTLDDREELKPNTTYIIQWGNAISDLTEGNKAENLVSVVATGNEVDSLRYKGRVVDQVTGRGEKDIVVMLYENVADSVVRTEKPYYFAKTQSDGSFEFQYLKGGAYKIFALKDANNNYLFDQPTEKIAFSDTLVTIPDTSGNQILLKVFQEDLPITVVDQQFRTYGVLKLLFNTVPSKIETNRADIFDNPSFQTVSKDTLLIWYSDTSQMKKDLIVYQDDRSFRDTIAFKIPRKKEKDVRNVAIKPNTVEILAKDTAVLQFTQPIEIINLDSVRIRKDSIEYTAAKWMQAQASNPSFVNVELDYQELSEYYLMFLPNALTNIWGDTNKDTLRQQISVLPIKEFGDLNITLTLPDSVGTVQYLVELQNSDKEILQQHTVSNTARFTIQQKTVPAGSYQIQVIEDTNKNGRKDAGSYDEKRQPERIFLKKLEELRKNWELEATVPVEF